jgi:hypothetical protein
VPVLTVDGEQLNDSSFIIKALDAKLRATGKKNARLWRPSSGEAKAEEEKWFRHARRTRNGPTALLRARR